MSYLVLARKWRPKDFADTVGQEHVLQALINALDTGRLHHAYLFTGTRGVGKTTIARILAKALNCAGGPRQEPCGTCDSCREITEGRSLDVLEIDGASNNSVEDVRRPRDPYVREQDEVAYYDATGRLRVPDYGRRARGRR